VATLCHLLDVSRSGYYAWRTRPPSARARANQELTRHIRAAHEQSRGTYGAPRIWAELRDRGLVCSRKRVARLLRLAGLQGCHRRKGPAAPRRTPGPLPAPDLVRRDFAAPAPDRLWVADITYVPTWAGFLYLAVVLDAHSRRIVGWAMADHLRSELVIDAVDMAVWRRRPTPGVIHHADQGRQDRAWPSDGGCAKPGSSVQWGAAAIASTTRRPRASLPPSNASCSLVTASRRGAPPASRYSMTSKGSPTCTGDTPRSAISPPPRMRGGAPRNRSSPTSHLSTKQG
jgi:putative transposase